MVPINSDEDGNITEPINIQHPFMRGIMNFDDYNYKNFNDYVLIEEPGSFDKKQIIEERK